MQPDSIIIAQSPIQISTAAPTHYVSFSTHIFPYYFKIFLGPFWGPQGLLPTIFEFLFSRYESPYFFRRFDIFSHFLLQGIETLMIIEPPDNTLPILFQSVLFFGPFSGAPGALVLLFSNSPSPATCPHIFSDVSTPFLTSFFRGLRFFMIIEPPDGGVLTTCCRILSLLRNHIYQSPRRHLLTTYASQHTHFLILSEIFFQNFLAPFPGPPGLLSTIFEFPYSRYIPSNFFRRFNIISHFLLHNVEPPDDRQSAHVETGVTNLWAVAHTWPVFFPPHPYAWREAVDTYLHRHPYARTLLVL